MIARWSIGLLALAVLADPAARSAAAADYALLVGVSSYDKSVEFESLKYPGHDAVELERVLRRANFKVVTLTTEAGKKDERLAPIYSRILEELAALRNEADEDSTIIIVLCGHGLTIEQLPDLDDPIKNKARKGPCFLTADTKYDESIEQKYINFIDIEREVIRPLKDCVAPRKHLFVDACRNTSSTFLGPVPPKLTRAGRRLLQQSKVNVIYACREKEKSKEHDDLKSGVFSYFLIRALRGEAKGRYEQAVTFRSLFRFLEDNVSGYAKNVLDGHEQHPDADPDQRESRQMVVPYKPLGAREVVCGEDAPPYDGPAPTRRSIEDFDLVSLRRQQEMETARRLRNREPGVVATFEDQTFTGTFRGTGFDGITFRECRFKDCVFADVGLANTKMIDCIFENADFTRANARLLRIEGSYQGDPEWDSARKPSKLPRRRTDG
jgi:hypothetical protein